MGSGHFGQAEELAMPYGMLGFLIIISCVVLIETGFHHLHQSTFETPYAEMVSTIEKELMIVGFIAFFFKLLLSAYADSISHDWLGALEFAG